MACLINTIELRSGKPFQFNRPLISEGLYYDSISKKQYYLKGAGRFLISKQGYMFLSSALATATHPVFTNVRTGARTSIFDPTSDVAANTADIANTGSMQTYSSMASSTNTVSADMDSDWSITTGGTITKIDSRTWEFFYNDEDTLQASNLVDGMFNRFGKFDVRKISGQANNGSYFQFRQFTSKVGTAYDLQDAVADWTTAEFSVTDAVDSNRIASKNAGSPDTAVTLQIRNVRAADNYLCPTAPHASGSLKGDTYGADILSSAPTFAAQGTIFFWMFSYGYETGAQIPVNQAARIIDIPGSFHVRSPGNLFLYDSGGAQAVATATGISGRYIPLFGSVDWDGANIGIRVGRTFARTAAADTVTPVGKTLYLGNRSAGDRNLHGGCGCVIKDYVIGDSEYLRMISEAEANLANFKNANGGYLAW